MRKDSRIDPKEVREQKANGGQTMAQSANDGEDRNHKKQSASRQSRVMINKSNRFIRRLTSELGALLRG